MSNPSRWTQTLWAHKQPEWSPEVLKHDEKICEYYEAIRGSYLWPHKRDAFDKCMKKEYNPADPHYKARHAIWFCHYSEPDTWRWWTLWSRDRPKWTPEILKYDNTIDEYYDATRGRYLWPHRLDAFDKCMKQHYDPKHPYYRARQAIWYCHYSEPDKCLW